MARSTRKADGNAEHDAERDGQSADGPLVVDGRDASGAAQQGRSVRTSPSHATMRVEAYAMRDTDGEPLRARRAAQRRRCRRLPPATWRRAVELSQWSVSSYVCPFELPLARARGVATATMRTESRRAPTSVPGATETHRPVTRHASPATARPKQSSVTPQCMSVVTVRSAPRTSGCSPRQRSARSARAARRSRRGAHVRRRSRPPLRVSSDVSAVVHLATPGVHRLGCGCCSPFEGPSARTSGL